MSAYVFRHYDGTKHPENPRRNNFLFDNENMKPGKKNTHHHHHHYYHNLDDGDQRKRRHHQQQQHHHPDDHHIHYLPPARSLPPLMYEPYSPRSRYRPDIRILKTRSVQMFPPRIAVEDRRHHSDRESNVCYDYCPHKSSKAIPSMYYDKLRCPHCLAHVQPSQSQVQAYPWTEVNYKSRKSGPNSHTSQDGSYAGSRGVGSNAEKLQPSDFSLKPIQMRTESETNEAAQIETKTYVNASLHSNNSHIASVTNGRAQVRSIAAHPDMTSQKTQSVAAPSSRMFGTGERIRGPKGTYRERDPTPFLPTRQFHDDDVQPHDSISNVEVPAMRAQTNLTLKGEYKDKEETEVDAAYPREKYFQSMREQHPGYAPTTPRPMPRNQQHSRRFEGQYYDRRNGQTYRYDVNLGNRSVYSDRRPFG